MPYKQWDIENYLIFFEGKISLDFAIEEIKKNTRRFAKRQLHLVS